MEKCPKHGLDICENCSLDLYETEVRELKLQIEGLKKNDYTGDYCNVCKLGIREKEARSESFGVWTHPLCSVISQRDAALRLNDELRKALTKIDAMRKRLPDPDFNEQRNTAAGISEIIQVALAEKRKCEVCKGVNPKFCSACMGTGLDD